MSATDQAVIVCGGRGTRLASVLGDRPKVLAPVGGRLLLDHLLSDLAAAGTKEVLLLAGFGADRVEESAKRLAPEGLRLQTVVESFPRGTAGALHGVSDRLGERFLLVYGDVFTALDWGRLADAAEENQGLATLAVHRSSHPVDSDLARLDDGDRVIAWSSRGGAASAPAALTNAGIAVVHRDILRYIPRERPSDLFSEVVPALVDARAPLFGYRTCEYVRDLGTPERLEVVDHDVSRGLTRKRAELALLDRDGVINEEAGYICKPEQLRLQAGAAAGVRALNQAGIRVVVVTNQAVAARGLCSEESLGRIHQRLESMLSDQGARLDGLYYCPHHPETHHGEGVAALRGPCHCRKPSVGMVEAALEDQGIEAWRTVVVGDRTLDMQLAHNAGLAGIALDTGIGCRDGRYPARPVWRFADLQAAAAWLCGTTK